MHNAIIGTLAALFGGVVLSSCSKRSKAPTATESAGQILAMDEGSGQIALEKKFADYGKDLAFDGEGNLNRKDSKRSSFEGKQMSNIGGDLTNKEFAATRYSKKNWKGSKNFDTGKFTNSKNRWDNEEYFVQKQAQESGTAARSQGQAYATGDYRTSTAREQAGDRLSRPGDLKTEIRQRDSPKPLIMDNEDYEKMSLNDSKRLLGRD
ncbi:MAG: hypothetical protein ACSHYB_07140 [Roseibacillus sp.]